MVRNSKMTPEQRQILIDAGIPLRYLEARLKTFNPGQDNRAALQAVVKHVEALEDGDSGGLVISGPVGTGKTHLACAIAYELLKVGERVWFTTLADLLRGLRVGKGRPLGDKLGEAYLWQRATQVKTLILDDVGAGQVPEWEISHVDHLVNARYNTLLPTICTTNLTPPEFSKLIGARAMDRILSRNNGWIGLVGDSRR
jgi:DNA replication protein DnaC